MRKLLSVITILTLSLSVAFAEGKSDVFNYNEQQINAEFGKVNKLESYVNAHEGTTLADVKANNAELTKGISLDTNVSQALAKDLPIGIPAFWWGCVLGLLGVILVYILTDQDKEQTKSALWGCLVWIGVFLLWDLVILGSSSRFL